MFDPIPEAAAWAIVLLPLASFAIIALASLLSASGVRLWRPAWSGYLTVLAIAAALALSVWALDSAVQSDGHAVGFAPHEWVTVGPLTVDIGFRLDGLSALMLVVVTGVSLMVQVYSQGYMAGDPGYSRYFAFMSLFTGAMLGLVAASSILQLFVFWELVGLCSYLLIGFWFHREAARRAATKAFLVTRLGDLGLISAILLIWWQTGELDIARIHEAVLAGTVPAAVVAYFAGGVFAGAAGKSAQFPLHVWLPDAMEGPTPVSALIHAATMVAAGVYLVARLFPAYALAEEAITTVAVIGAVTAIMSALLGVVATDIKRVLAYSTISQLGYMMAGLGSLAFAPAMFHLFTHAFFKALLFLGAGSVNHATGTFDMRRMGGLARSMPVTFLTMSLGALALVGLFPLAGFWSKDELLAVAWDERPAVFWALLVGVFLTALYVGRMLFLTFAGEYRGGEAGAHGHAPSHPHESPPVMLLPMVLLAGLAAAVGLTNLGHGVEHLLVGALPSEAEGLAAEPHFRFGIAAASVALGLAGLAVAWAIYGARVVPSEDIARALAPLHRLLERRYYLDDLYEGVITGRLVLAGLARGLYLWDRYVVDGIVNGIAQGARETADRLRLAQAGQPQVYGAFLALGIVVATVVVLLANP
ncbi:MAG TPA: NADH-quinone oxidoreductase subunit L [Dehalococcoidia bacterium]|nr:NADH-quinone oxidoreductase subunit L [Dehalococcoidia bacterium]